MAAARSWIRHGVQSTCSPFNSREAKRAFSYDTRGSKRSVWSVEATSDALQCNKVAVWKINLSGARAVALGKTRQ